MKIIKWLCENVEVPRWWMLSISILNLLLAFGFIVIRVAINVN